MNDWYFIYFPNPRKQKLLLLHGLTSDAHILVPLAKHLKKYFEIFIPAFPGIGETKVENINSISDLTNGIYQFGKEHNVFPCNVLGTSMGGTSALLLSQKYPNIFTNIFVHDPPWRKTSIHFGLFQEFELIISKIIAIYPKLLKDKHRVKSLLNVAAILKPDLAVLIKKYESKIIKVLVDTDIKTTLNLVRDLRDSDFTTQFKNLINPVNIICGEMDQVVFPSETKELTNIIPNTKLFSLADADHDLVLDDPINVSEIILSVCLPQNKI